MRKHLFALSSHVPSFAHAAAAYADKKCAYTGQSSSNGGDSLTTNRSDDGNGACRVTAGAGGGNPVGDDGTPFLQGEDAGNVTVIQTGTGDQLGVAGRGKRAGSGNTPNVTQAGPNGRDELQEISSNHGVAPGPGMLSYFGRERPHRADQRA
ncbi:curlin associated [Methylobacterium sp. 4-46]|nr:curlin associated [Methylobacterium sp. 4-46]